MHKVISTDEINKILENKPKTDINAKTTQDMTPVDSLVARALRAKRQCNNIVEFDQHMDMAMYLVGKGTRTEHESVADYLFDQMALDLRIKKQRNI